MNRLTCFCIPVPLPLQNPLSLRGQFSNWPWQSVPPVPSAPLPKGGCHGAAVTGGFLPRTALLVTLRRGGVLPRPREGQSPSPTHRKIRFRRAGCPQPAARQPPHHHGGVRARRPTQVFRHFRRGGRLCPPVRACTAFLVMCHCEPVTDVTGVAIRLPRPQKHLHFSLFTPPSSLIFPSFPFSSCKSHAKPI